LQLRWGTCFGYPETINPFRIYLYHRRKICGKVVKDYTQEDDDMTTISDGGPAFPAVGVPAWPDHNHGGMTLRDWFATHATEADILAAQGAYRVVTRYEARYIHADEMLKAREVKP
jgi:hypothetical protein